MVKTKNTIYYGIIAIMQ